MSKHTKGPWRVREGMERAPQRVFDSDGRLVAEAHSLQETLSKRLAEAQANAHLIAAAPELLEACKYGLDTLLAQPNADDMGLYQIQAAIAKAEPK